MDYIQNDIHCVQQSKQMSNDEEHGTLLSYGNSFLPNSSNMVSLLENFSTILLEKCDQVLLRGMSEYEIQLYRDVMATLIEKSLLKIDPMLISKTEKELQRYNMTFNDLLENPDNCCMVLKNTLGDEYLIFINTLNEEMTQISKNSLFEKFLKTLNK